MSLSLMAQVAAMSEAEQDAWLADLDDDLARSLASEPWWFVGRPEQHASTGDWIIWLILSGRGWGKALDVATPIPTPDGWTKLGDLAVGSTVFDEAGQPCTVTGIYDQGSLPGWRLTFSDGATLDACDDHLWVTVDQLDRKARNRSGRGLDGWADRDPIDTRTLVDTLHRGKRGDRNHAIPIAAPLATPEADLPIDPYVLGAWLGDGSSACAELTCHDDDAPHYIERFAAAGITLAMPRRRDTQRPVATWGIGRRPLTRDPATGRMVANGSLHSTLRSTGLLGNKHVPGAYLRASTMQRLALLQGLMDTDGYLDPPSGNAEFTSTRRPLADAVMELTRTLSQKPVLHVGVARLNGRAIGPKYRVTWRPTICPVSLPRKVAAYRPLAGQAMRSMHRMIVAAERIPPTPMRCITVNSPHHLFLAGDAMIPTHNTRTGAEWLVDQITLQPTAPDGEPTQWGIMAETFSDARKVCVEGPSGLLSVCRRRGIDVDYNRSTFQITFPSGSVVHLFGADSPDAGRGYNLAGLWCDEFAKWRYPQLTWTEGVLPALRIGTHPRACITTTPKPLPIIREWKARTDGSVMVTVGSTYDNAANLSPAALAEFRARYEGTRLGRQELHGEVLDDIEGALWAYSTIDRHRVDEPPPVDARTRVVVAIDPAVTSGEDSDETGIVAACLDRTGHAFVLEDLSGRYAPTEWARVAIGAYHRWSADAIVAEVNNGGDMVEATVRAIDPDASYRAVRASRGKITRAEPIAALYEQGRVHHVGNLGTLEDQMTTWSQGDTPKRGSSPDRMDALVWAITELIPNAGQGAAFLEAWRQALPADERKAALDAVLAKAKATPSVGSGCEHRWFAGACAICGDPAP